ncbi:hypothetical protein JWG39_06185 [Desulforhopalus vacuolatus]|uniref:hypothetical protein n=1 Tax=Desulforhopalus vacuolatus TaxID=40414 RepID=UPI001963EC9E|nr:hypothetical protein [Desulforhopalus vacuolatus]MBM9519408.1 hypothetical protein [Desulforhopalus vacuolatus]
MNQPAPLPHDIYGPVTLPEPLFSSLEILGIILCAAAALAALFFLYRRLHRHKAVPLQEEYLRRFEALRPLRKESTVRWVEEANNLLRSYIERRFSLRSTRQTTNEFLHSPELKNLSPLQEVQTELRRCLEQADLAKFARYQPKEEELNEMEKAIRVLIKDSQTEDKGGQ